MKRNRRKPEPESADDPGRIREAALGLLARREHSASELSDKLVARGWSVDTVGTVVGKLAASGLQSDERFIGSYIQSRVERGRGPVRIVHELMQHGIDAATARSAVDASEVDWFGQAVRARTLRFGEGAPGDWPEKAKQLRFLQQRGFDNAQARAAMDEGSGGA